jgi:hypothetical protein
MKELAVLRLDGLLATELCYRSLSLNGTKVSDGVDDLRRRNGDLLEDLVAMMHDVPGFLVEKRKKLRVLKSKKKRYREIDVLITTNVAGHPVQIAIGCKNEKKLLGTGAVDNFVRILQTTGIPVGHGILVSNQGNIRATL